MYHDERSPSWQDTAGKPAVLILRTEFGVLIFWTLEQSRGYILADRAIGVLSAVRTAISGAVMALLARPIRDVEDRRAELAPSQSPVVDHALGDRPVRG
jgi:hypothetical protein